MEQLGVSFFYPILLFILLTVFVISILNLVYYGNARNEGSENISPSLLNQMVIVNFALIVLVFICFCITGYMYTQTSNTYKEKLQLEKRLKEKQQEHNDKMEKTVQISDEMKKKREYIKTLTDISNENDKLVKEVKTLSTKIDKKDSDDEISVLSDSDSGSDSSSDSGIISNKSSDDDYVVTKYNSYVPPVDDNDSE